MTVTTATGKELNPEMVVENPTPPRLYMHFSGESMWEIGSILMNPEELPLEEYPTYTQVQSISQNPSVVVALRP